MKRPTIAPSEKAIMSDDSAAELPSEFVEIDGAPVEVTYPDRPTKVVEFFTGLFGKPTQSS
jgi:hypothetical protein